MKRIINNIKGLFALSFLTLGFSGCTLFGLDLQEDYEYKKFILDDHIHMSAWDYLKLRANGTPQNPGDTVFRWMKKAIDYSGIDTTEYMKPNRTFIFLHNEAIRRVNATQVLQNNCFFYDFPILRKNTNGSVITPVLPADGAKSWNQYDKETVKKYLQYLIIEGNYNYNNLSNTADTVKTLLAPGSVATRESKLGYIVGFETPGDPGSSYILKTDYTNGGKGFDQEGKADLRLRNDRDSKVYFNGYFAARTGGIYADNGAIHVFGTTVWPLRF